LGATAQGHPVSNGGCPTSFVYGKRTRPSQTFAKGPFGLTGVVFKPQGLSTLLNTHPMRLNDGSVELNEFSRENIGEQLLNARSHHERVARLGEFLRAHVDNSGSEDALVTESLRLIQKEIRSIRVPRLLKCLNVSERQFERRFVRAIGVSPHHYIRILRFREAVRLIKANQFERLSDVAYDLNYVDQSHFIKDIKAVSGYNADGPRSDRSGRYPPAVRVDPGTNPWNLYRQRRLSLVTTVSCCANSTTANCIAAH
jgi:AraC-like DNA-binding protein